MMPAEQHSKKSRLSVTGTDDLAGAGLIALPPPVKLCDPSGLPGTWGMSSVTPAGKQGRKARVRAYAQGERRPVAAAVAAASVPPGKPPI